MLDVAVIGAGPIGIACAAECQRRGLQVAVIDQGCLCHALYNYPRNMRFFSTAERIAICGIPFPCPQPRPSRDDALHYYRAVAEHFQLDLQLYQAVTQVSGVPDDFQVHTRKQVLPARRVVLATGFFDTPVPLNVPGEALPKVSHRFIDAHPYAGQDLAIIGGANSAVIAALECWRGGARVTVIHRGAAFRDSVKYWLRPDIENRIKEGSIRAFFNATVETISADTLTLRGPAGTQQLANDFVLALTGYRSDYRFFDALDIARDPHSNAPLLGDPCGESASRPGIYILGSARAGDHTNDIFIENTRDDALALAEHFSHRLRR